MPLPLFAALIAAAFSQMLPCRCHFDFIDFRIDAFIFFMMSLLPFILLIRRLCHATLRFFLISSSLSFAAATPE